jgi:hypothetical protein
MVEAAVRRRVQRTLLIDRHAVFGIAAGLDADRCSAIAGGPDRRALDRLAGGADRLAPLSRVALQWLATGPELAANQPRTEAGIGRLKSATPGPERAFSACVRQRADTVGAARGARREATGSPWQADQAPPPAAGDIRAAGFAIATAARHAEARVRARVVGAAQVAPVARDAVTSTRRKRLARSCETDRAARPGVAAALRRRDTRGRFGDPRFADSGVRGAVEPLLTVDAGGATLSCAAWPARTRGAPCRTGQVTQTQ